MLVEARAGSARSGRAARGGWSGVVRSSGPPGLQHAAQLGQRTRRRRRRARSPRRPRRRRPRRRRAAAARRPSRGGRRRGRGKRARRRRSGSSATSTAIGARAGLGERRAERALAAAEVEHARRPGSTCASRKSRRSAKSSGSAPSGTAVPDRVEVAAGDRAELGSERIVCEDRRDARCSPSAPSPTPAAPRSALLRLLAPARRARLELTLATPGAGPLATPALREGWRATLAARRPRRAAPGARGGRCRSRARGGSPRDADVVYLNGGVAGAAAAGAARRGADGAARPRPRRPRAAPLAPRRRRARRLAARRRPPRRPATRTSSAARSSSTRPTSRRRGRPATAPVVGFVGRIEPRKGAARPRPRRARDPRRARPDARIVARRRRPVRRRPGVRRGGARRARASSTTAGSTTPPASCATSTCSSCPSREEPFGTVARRGDGGGHAGRRDARRRAAEVVEDGVTGALVDARADPRELAAAVARACSARRDEMGAAARERARRFGADAYAERVERAPRCGGADEGRLRLAARRATRAGSAATRAACSTRCARRRGAATRSSRPTGRAASTSSTRRGSTARCCARPCPQVVTLHDLVPLKRRARVPAHRRALPPALPRRPARRRGDRPDARRRRRRRRAPRRRARAHRASSPRRAAPAFTPAARRGGRGGARALRRPRATTCCGSAGCEHARPAQARRRARRGAARRCRSSSPGRAEPLGARAPDVIAHRPGHRRRPRRALHRRPRARLPLRRRGLRPAAGRGARLRHAGRRVRRPGACARCSAAGRRSSTATTSRASSRPPSARSGPRRRRRRGRGSDAARATWEVYAEARSRSSR